MSEARELVAFLNPKRADDPLSLRRRKIKRTLTASFLIGVTTFNLWHISTQVAPGHQTFSSYGESLSRDHQGALIRDVIAVNTVVFLTSGTSYSRPADWNNAANSIEGIGGGAGGRPGNICFSAAGGEGGGYAKIVNQTLAASTAYAIGAGGASNANGGNTTFINSATLLARGGNTAATQAGSTTRLGGAGGLSTGTAANRIGGGGGGGAGGPNAAGVVGVNSGANGGNGGQGDGTFGGTGGAGGASGVVGSPGNPGAEYTATAGGTAGSGGGGGGGGNARAGGAGALYGGGGGGGGTGNVIAGGLGAQGLIVIIYTPIAGGPSPAFNQGYIIG